MSEPDISTLARRLAEQNNVDWRVLRGSGPEGKVVERDVLDYLAKVMAGEEAVNPTPEPVPEGMESWPEQDIQGFRAGVGEAATLGELRDELGNASRDYVPPSAVGSDGDDAFDGVGTAPHGRGSDGDMRQTYGTGSGGAARFDEAGASRHRAEDTIDEDIFLFDDDQEPVVAVPLEPVVAAAAEAMHVADDLDDLLVAGDDLDAGDGAAAHGGDTFATAAEDARFGAVSTGYLGDGRSLDGYSDTVDDLGMNDGDEIGSRFAAELDDGADTTSVAASAAGSSWGADISFGGGGAAAGQDGSVPDLWGPAATAEHDDSDLWTGPTASDDESDATVTVGALVEEVAEEAVDLAGFQADDGTSVEEPDQPRDVWLGDEAFSDDQPAAGAFAAGSHVDEVVEPEPFHTDPDESDVGEQSEVPAAATAGIGAGLAAVGATLLSAGATTLPLARPGTILRRNIDVSALAAAQLAVGQELGYDEPLGASAFLLRAVVKAASSTGFGSGAIGLAVLEESLVIRRVDGAAEMPFTALVQALGTVDLEEDEPVLVAADLSGLDVDEAVLDLDMPVISLGRILYDNQRGAYRSTLSLTGPMPLDTAASLLARVAELLDAPVRLVL